MYSVNDLFRLDAIINENKKIVIQLLDGLLKSDNTICTCEHCILDIIAVTLNNLPPRYRIDLIGGIESDGENDAEYLKKISDELSHAIMRVSESPHHFIVFNQNNHLFK